jgi:flagellar biogenesis protein FliO
MLSKLFLIILIILLLGWAAGKFYTTIVKVKKIDESSD